MRAVLMFSAVVHLAVLGVCAAAALRRWADTRRPKDMTVEEYVIAAGALAVASAFAITLLMRLARPFGPAVGIGLVGGAIVAFAFLLALGAWPTPAPGHGGPSSLVARRVARVCIGTAIAVELVAFCFVAGAVAA